MRFLIFFVNILIKKKYVLKILILYKSKDLSIILKFFLKKIKPKTCLFYRFFVFVYNKILKKIIIL